MGFTQGTFPPVDPATFNDRPFFDRVRILSTQWAEYGFGTPKMVHVIYIVKLIVFYAIGGVTVATATSGLPAFWNVSDWIYEPIVYEKLVLWTVLLETIGVAGSWGPLAGHFKPMTGGFHYWARRGTLRMPPWPNNVPLTHGNERTTFDVALYVAIIVSLVVGLLVPSIDSVGLDAYRPDNAGLVPSWALLLPVALLIMMGLRDKVVFLGARSEQYMPALIFCGLLDFNDMIIALKLLIVVVWVGAGASKFGHHFSRVVSPMVSNTPWVPSRRFKRSLYRDFPNDMRPSHVTKSLAHVGGTTVEIVVPLVLLFSTNTTITLLGAVFMVFFHLFIISTFPLAVPLEWNVFFAYATIFLFVGHPAGDGFALNDFSSPLVLVVIVLALLFFPVLGNLRPDLVSFLPSLRQYAGNWASASWAFAPGAEQKLDQYLVKPARNTVEQLADDFGRDEAEVLLQMAVGWRAMHSQGPGLFSMLSRHLGDDLDHYSVREAEFCCNTVLGFNFGDAHFHNEDLIAAIQERCNFEPGEFIVAWVESQPINRDFQEYKLIDAALGVIERGTYQVADAVEQQPWLPEGPIPLTVTWSAGTN